MPIDLPQSESRPPAGTFDLPVAGEANGPAAAPNPATGHKHHPPAVRHHRPWIIGLAVLSAAMVGVLAVIVLYHRSSREEAYTNIIYVWAMDDSWKGAKVVVTGENLRFVDKLTEKNNLACRIHVPSGKFGVLVEKDGRTIARAESNPGLTTNLTWWPFRAPPSVTQPSEP